MQGPARLRQGEGYAKRASRFLPMPTLVVMHDSEDRATWAVAQALRDKAPVDLAIRVVESTPPGLGERLGDTPPDLLWLLDPALVQEARQLLQQRGWPTKLVASWREEPARRIGDFFELRPLADAWIFEDPRYWEIVGRLPDSFVAKHASAEGLEMEACVTALRQTLRGAAVTPRRDLRQDVTVFVSTVGSPDLELCLERLHAQDCRFTQRIIDHVAPMHRAFQCMLDQCETPYYVQVDEDMLLYPEAVRTLYDTIAAAPPSLVAYVAALYDPHLRRCILGIKIFRHEIVRKYPFREVEAFEVEQLRRLEKDGYTYRKTEAGMHPVPGQTLGIHAVRWTPAALYLRYRNLTRRTLDFPERMAWFRKYPAEFLRRFEEDPSAENFFALQGVIMGTLAGHQSPITSKDYRDYERTAGFESLLQGFQEITRTK